MNHHSDFTHVPSDPDLLSISVRAILLMKLAELDHQVSWIKGNILDATTTAAEFRTSCDNIEEIARECMRIKRMALAAQK